jgi:L-lactate dehydrogenase complex protein LldF
MEVTETDLGEFIAQIGGEAPSHLVAPVMHLTREEVGQIFEEHLDVPYTDDIIELNAIARQTLRRVFLTADMGISGCNFAVAESGSICLITNEGNGRMVTSLPDIHVAVMGLERIVPSLDDLTVLLEVLGRSATGQKLTSYTSIVTGPRRPGESHGPNETHLVIIDNGRSAIWASEYAEILHCIRCGACLNACPVYRAIGGHAYGSLYQGPLGSILTPLLAGVDIFPDLPFACTLCGACKDACPVKIDLPGLMLRLRRDITQAGLSARWLAMGMKAYGFIASRPKLFSIMTSLAGAASTLIPGSWYRGPLPPPLGGWTRARHFPLFARNRYLRQFRRR